MIKISISSDVVHSGKTTLAMELAKFLTERTGEYVEVVSDTGLEPLREVYMTENSLDGLKIRIEDLNGNSEEGYEADGLTKIKVVPYPGEELKEW
jgi:tRNA uridine 5-carbamoylmethylation protein Kti12